MSQRVVHAALLSLVAACAVPALPAHAEIDASGTRLSIAGGPARFYMTYGTIADAELYAPISGQLARTGVSVERSGDDYIVYVRGLKKATWAIVDSRDNVPETGEPCVLILGGNVYLPVKALASLGKLDVKWDKGSNLVAMNPAPVQDRTFTPAVNARIDPQGVTLSGVTLEAKGATTLLHIRTSAPLRPRLVRVNSDNPRLCLDFISARWADGLALPAGAGEVKSLRVGYPTAGMARITLDIAAGELNVTGVQIERDEITATISRGIQSRSFAIAPDAALLVQRRDALEARLTKTAGRSVSRGSLDDPNVLRQDFKIPGVGDENPEPEIGNTLHVIPIGTLSGKTIIVDPGHGGHHAGATGLNFLEKDLTMKMCFELQRSLEAKGAKVIMTRVNDDFVSLDQRCQMANTSGGDIFISIHCNSMPRRNMQSGSESYWHSSEQSRRLARALHPHLVASVRGRDGGIRNRSFQVIRETSMPSVLLEVAYINNTTDEILLADGGFHKRLAEQLTLGVMDYFGKDRSSP
jgi:N-acetylmuramoyl-L-alanine amidase